MILTRKIRNIGLSVSRFIGKRKPVVGLSFAQAPGLFSLMMALLTVFSLFLNFLYNNFFIIFDISFLSIVVPVKMYANADVQKLEILKENKGKSGIYL